MIDKRLQKHAVLNNNSKIKVAENKRQAIILNLERKDYYVIKVDGGLIKNSIASDYVVSKLEVGDVVIELKGMDVDHAVEQVLATAEYWSREGLRNGEIAGMVVCSRKPSFFTKAQRFQTTFARKFNAPLHIIPRNDEFVFERLLSFDGPK